MQFLSSIDFLALNANIFQYSILFRYILFQRQRKFYENAENWKKQKLREAFEKKWHLLQAYYIYLIGIEIIYIFGIYIGFYTSIFTRFYPVKSIL